MVQQVRLDLVRFGRIGDRHAGDFRGFGWRRWKIARPQPLWWRRIAFNEGTGTTVTDSSGNGNNGTITNATWSTAGKYGNALVFNGTNARVNINDSASLHLTTGDDAGSLGEPVDGQQRLAGRDLQGQRQLLAGGDLDQWQ